MPVYDCIWGAINFVHTHMVHMYMYPWGGGMLFACLRVTALPAYPSPQKSGIQPGFVTCAKSKTKGFSRFQITGC